MDERETTNVSGIAGALGVHKATERNWEARGVLRTSRSLRGGFRRLLVQDAERQRAEMFEQFAPAAEGPVVNRGRKRRGRLVFGDAME